MNRFLIALVSVTVLAGCASDPARRENIVKGHSATLPAPTAPLSSYGRFELKPMQIVDGVSNDAAKAEVAKDLERRIQERMQPMFARWSAESTGVRSAKTLIVQPRITKLRVIGGATRFFAGAFAGDSSIAMDLELRDAATGTVVANPTIARNANAFAGAYSVGSTDQNLLGYIADIATQYLEEHHLASAQTGKSQ